MAAERIAAIEVRMTQIEESFGKMRGDFAEHMNTLGEQKTKLIDDLNIEFAKSKITMDDIVDGARKEFHDLKQALQILHDQTNTSVTEIVKKVKEVEQGLAGGHGSSCQPKGYLPVKSMVPKIFSNKEEEWRR